MQEMNQSLLTESFERLLHGHCTPAQVRAIDRGESAAALWSAILNSGFLEALVPENKGGADLSLRDVHPLFELSGQHALPMPFGQTMLARAVLSRANAPVPTEPIVLANGQVDTSTGTLNCINIAHATSAYWALVRSEDVALLLPIAQAQREPTAPNTQAANLAWSLNVTRAATPLNLPAMDFMVLEACVLAPMIAGAMGSVLKMTLQYANDRIQFGRTLSKFQAIQHQIAVMAEHSSLARTAACWGSGTTEYLPDARRVAIAKAVTSEAAPILAAMGHAIHGAIGITAEFNLQLFTRRLHEWRLCAGSEVYWNRRIGAAMISSNEKRVLDFIR